MDFIGIGAQRSGTSWLYACLYEHPEICSPIKELHFFSRERNWKFGVAWYREKFSKCDPHTLKGEYSTSYLYSDVAAKRIHKHFPHAKIVASLRNPIDRAFSQYRNAIKAGEIEKETTFEEYIESEESVIDQGLYTEQVKRYLDRFHKDQMHFMIYEETKGDPAANIQKLYEFIGIKGDYSPVMLHKKVNTGRTPRAVGLDRTMIRVAESMRHMGLDKLVWHIKRTGLPKLIRKANTEDDTRVMSEETRERLRGVFREDVQALGGLLGKDLNSVWEI